MAVDHRGVDRIGDYSPWPDPRVPVEARGQRFVGPDNGVLEWALAAPGAALTLRARDAFTASTSLGEVGGVPRFGSVSSATAASGAAGTLAIDAARIDIDGSTLISGHTSGSGTGANVRVSASESVRVAGFASLLAFTTGEGRAGDLDLRAPRIDFEDFGAVNATAFATGAAAAR